MSPREIDPYPESPGDHDRCIENARARIRALDGLPDELKAELLSKASMFVEATLKTAPKTTHFFGMQLGWKQWAVRNDHLDLVSATGPTAVALAAYATAAAPASPAILAVTLLFSSLGVARKVGKKAAALSHEAYAVLMALKRLGRAKISEIQGALVDIRVYPVGTWSETRLTEILKQLQSVTVNDGSIEAFVVTDGSGYWSANGI